LQEIRQEIRFLLNGKPQTLKAAAASDTLLDYIRLDAGLSGTKEGCAEGDCGACTVLIGSLENGQLHYQTVNTCIRLLATVDCCHVVTVEYLRNLAGGLHPVQQAMIDYHGSQCGFCTPGIIMSLYALWLTNPAPDEVAIETALQGNLCRCTGYQPIIEAALQAARSRDLNADPLWQARAQDSAQLAAMSGGERVELRSADSLVILPADVNDLTQCLADYPNATLVAGATDVGLWVTKFMRDISPVIYLGHLAELKNVEVAKDKIIIGAGVSYSAAEALIATHFPFLNDYWSRIGGWQVRNMGTIGGNIANGSPIGDTPPPLIVLNAEILLRSTHGVRRVPIEDYFIAYGKQDRNPGEFVESIEIPRLPEGAKVAAYKISKRRDEDISSLCAAFHVQVAGNIVMSAKIAFGGMAATPSRAKSAEAALLGQELSEAAIGAASRGLADDFSPISDMRASAGYRLNVAQNLLHRFFLEQADGATDQVELQV
jgi:xanthine dehydrogenase small subunit